MKPDLWGSNIDFSIHFSTHYDFFRVAVLLHGVVRIRKKVREREREEGKKEEYICGTYQCTALNKHSVNIYIVILLLLTFKTDREPTHMKKVSKN